MPFKLIEAEKLYQRDPNLRPQSVEKILRWLKKQKHLPNIEEIQILIMLHKNHYEIEAAKTALEHYLTVRNLCPDIFVALTPDTLKTTTSVACINIFPKRTPEGHVIIILKLLDEKTSDFNFTHVVNLINMVITIHLHQHGFEHGFVALFDAKGFTFGHLIRFKINAIRYALKHLQGGAPVKLKGIHVINAFSLVDKVVALLKPFLRTKLYKKIQIHHPKSDTVYKFLPKDCLPEEYGGDLPSSQVLNERSLKNMLENYDFYSWHDKQLSDESKRERHRN